MRFWRDRAGAQAKLAMEADQLSRIWGMQQEDTACNKHQLQLKKWQGECADYKLQHDFADAIDLVQLLQVQPERPQENNWI